MDAFTHKGENTGMVFAIEEFSTFDGPGVRTTVFLKGCPLRCLWCHNPEGQRFDREAARNINTCIGCGLCSDGIRLENIPHCPAQALRLCGETYTAPGLAGRLMKNAAILKDCEGGITFSGGEPLGQAEFLFECLEILRPKLHCAVQTSGYCSTEKFREMLKKTDFVLYDLKIIDGQEHVNFTGQSNGFVLENFGQLCRSTVPYRVRVPLIPGVTDNPENIAAIAGFMRKNGAVSVDVLPYNKMAGGKYPMVGRSYTTVFDGKEERTEYMNIFAAEGIAVNIL